MRFKNQPSHGEIPTVDLIPMLNVMMAVLAFFVLISMTLSSGVDGVDIQLPSDEQADAEQSQDLPDFLIVELQADGQIIVEEQPFEESQILEQVQLYLSNDEEGIVVLISEPETSYEAVLQLLAQMRKVSDETRVSLGIIED